MFFFIQNKHAIVKYFLMDKYETSTPDEKAGVKI